LNVEQLIWILVKLICDIMVTAGICLNAGVRVKATVCGAIAKGSTPFCCPFSIFVAV
jgi:hypothetical protein